MIEISLRDHDASWKKYTSFDRVWTISKLYKKTRTLQREIERSKSMSSQRRTDWELQLVQLKRSRHSLNSDGPLLTV
ncbi:hypothetical protein BT96DRAFT_919431, partial [Gymnopus androsaceus JB14]